MIITWQVPDLMQTLGIDPSQCITGVKLSIDGRTVEFRIAPSKVINQLLHTLVDHGLSRKI